MNSLTREALNRSLKVVGIIAGILVLIFLAGIGVFSTAKSKFSTTDWKEDKPQMCVWTPGADGDMKIECDRGSTDLKWDGQPFPVKVNGSPEGRLPQWWGIVININTGKVVTPPYHMTCGAETSAEPVPAPSSGPDKNIICAARKKLGLPCQ